MKEERFPRQRHPLCTCPPWEPMFDGTPEPDRSACAYPHIAHPVLDANDIAEIIRAANPDR